MKDNFLQEYNYVFSILVIFLFISGILSRFLFNDFFDAVGTDVFKIFFVAIFIVVAFNKLSSDFNDEAVYREDPSKLRRVSDFHYPIFFLVYIILNYLVTPFFVGIVVSTILTIKV